MLSGDQIFELYQHPVLDPTRNNTQIGTYQGYGFNFPNNTPNNNDIVQGNHELFLKGGYLSVFNEIIVAADGEYTKYWWKVAQDYYVFQVCVCSPNHFGSPQA